MNLFKFLKAIEPLLLMDLKKLDFCGVDFNSYQTVLEIYDKDYRLTSTVVIPNIKSYNFAISHFEDSFKGDTITISYSDFHSMDASQLNLSYGRKDLKCLDIVYNQLEKPEDKNV